MTLLLTLLACAPDPKPTDTGTTPTSGSFSDCDPIAPTLCGLPFPSTFHMRPDEETPSGWRVALGPTTLPVNSNGQQPDPAFWNERDGWSPMTPLYAHFPGLALDGLAGHGGIDRSLEDDSPTVLIDLGTGARVPHWAELDMSQDDDDRRLLILHPAVPLSWSGRYVVGLRRLVDASGAAIEPSPAFLALRDGGAAQGLDNPWDVEGRRALFDETIFPALEAQGWDRAEVQLAWDFVVASKEGTTGKALWMRDDALAALGEGPAYTLTAIEDLRAEGGDTAFRLKGTMTVPRYTEEDAPGAVLSRGPTRRDGVDLPEIVGETTVPFTIIVPMTAVEDPRPLALVQYGHGLLGGQGEVENGYLASMAHRFGWILFAVDWTGMKSEDTSAISLMLVNEIDRFAIIPERSQQGFVEFLAAMRLMSGPMRQEAALGFEHPETGEIVNVIDPERRYYYGNSQGAILGGAYIALSPDIERAALGVGGTPYALLLHRSRDFETFFVLFKTMYPDPAQVTLWLGLMQALWDSGETAGYATVTAADPLPGTPAKEVLLQVAIGDAQVTTLGAQMHARALGAKLIAPVAREVWGLEVVEEVAEGSALVEWDYGLAEPVENVPPEGDDPHESPRREEAGQEQIAEFFEGGVIRNICGGICQGD